MEAKTLRFVRTPVAIASGLTSPTYLRAEPLGATEHTPVRHLHITHVPAQLIEPEQTILPCSNNI